MFYDNPITRSTNFLLSFSFSKYAYNVLLTIIQRRMVVKIGSLFYLLYHTNTRHRKAICFQFFPHVDILNVLLLMQKADNLPQVVKFKDEKITIKIMIFAQLLPTARHEKAVYRKVHILHIFFHGNCEFTTYFSTRNDYYRVHWRN